MLQRVSFAVHDVERIGVLHLPDGDARGAALVLHGLGGHPDQPHIVETATALAACGVAAYRFPYRDHQPPRMTLASSLEDGEAALAVLRAHERVASARLALVGFSFGGAVAALLAGRERSVTAVVLAAAPSRRDGQHDPVSALARSKARVLLLWGAKDTEVSTLHAERYETALTKARVPYERVIVEGADHDFGPAARRAEMVSRLAGWVRGTLDG